MGTRCGFTIKEKGEMMNFSRHWDGYPSGIASDLTNANTQSVISLIDNLNMNKDWDSGIEYHYDFDMDNGTIAAYEADWKTDEKTNLLFEGTIEEFIEKFYNND